MADVITVASSSKTESIDLNGGMSIGAVLAKFFNVSERDLETKLAGQSVRLNSAGLSIPDGLSTPARDRDFVSIYTAEVARGGVKGAR